MLRARRTMLAFVVLLTAPSLARANGRFPAAQDVQVGPGADDREIVLRTTFGLVVSQDRGASFHWVCEEALSYSGVWDPPVALGHDGAINVGLPDGLVHSDDGCVFDRVATLDNAVVQDLASNPSGTQLLGVESVIGAANHVLASSDDGATWTRLGSGVMGALFATVDAAPSLPSRVYATAIDESTRAPRLFRSDDGGATLTELHPDLLGGTDAYLSAIDPTDPNTVYVRSNRGDGTVLLRSSDAGETFVEATTTRGAMLGFALSDDGRRVWIGGPDDGLSRSDDGGHTFAHVADTRVACLRYHAGALYVGADWLHEPFALARWTDGASAPAALLAFADIAGPVACAADTVESQTCGARWPAQREMFVRRADDAGVRSDAAVDGATGTDASDTDARNIDAAVAMDGGVARPSASCGCRAGRVERGAWAWALLAILLARQPSGRVLRRVRVPMD